MTGHSSSAAHRDAELSLGKWSLQQQLGRVEASPNSILRGGNCLATAYLPGLAMRRIADLHPGTAKTDARDAFVIADAARALPHTLRSVDIAGPAMADLSVLMGYDDPALPGHR